MSSISWNINKDIKKGMIKDFLEDIDEEFSPKLKKRSLSDYALKLEKNALFVTLYDSSKLCGMIGFYANDPQKKTTFISFISLQKEMRKKGYGRKMINSLLEYVKNMGFTETVVEVWSNSPNEMFYKESGFIPIPTKNKKRVKLIKWHGSINSRNDDFYSSQLEYEKFLSQEFSINLFIKRDDLYPKFGGGNKARKLDFILSKAKNDKFNAIVTAGGNQSNHARATSLYAASLGWKSIMIIHDKMPEILFGNLKLMKLAGSEIRHVNKEDVKPAMDKAMEDLSADGYKPFYIWGGGHCLEGAYAYYDAVSEIKNQLGNISPDFLIVASGTGTTQAGLEIGIRKYYPNCQVLGVSIARNEEKGKPAILQSMAELNDYLGGPVQIPKDIFFDTNCGIGHESTSPELIESIQFAIKKGLIVDPTYTGKAFYALTKYIKNGIIPPQSNVVFWHTGGVMNLLTSIAI